MKKIVLFKGKIETLEYFSARLNDAFIKNGYKTFIFNFNSKKKSFNKLKDFYEENNTVMITFNGIGIFDDKILLENDKTFWDINNIPCINIMVDHPLYYHMLLRNPPKNYIQICIDYDHLDYIKRFFKNIKHLEFLPLAGTKITDNYIPFNNRPYDIIFTGNYSRPETFDKYINRIDDEYSKFYHNIIDDFLNDPSQPLLPVFEKHIKNNVEDIVTDNGLCGCIPSFNFIDLYIRFYFRGEIIKTLVDNGFKVHTFGAGYQTLDCKHKENIIMAGSVNSKSCLENMLKSKISLNIMPWFKSGAHDRIFNSCLAKTVCVSDSSSYLDNIFTDKKDIAFYSLKNLEKIPNIIDYLLTNPSISQEISENGYNTTINAHTWEHRANSLIKIIENI